MIEGSENIEKQVLEKVTPTPKERTELEKVIKELKEAVKKESEKSKLSISIELVGSTAKDTYLRNNLDIDLFLTDKEFDSLFENPLECALEYEPGENVKRKAKLRFEDFQKMGDGIEVEYDGEKESCDFSKLRYP